MSFLNSIFFVSTAFFVSSLSAEVVITEIMASNRATLADEDGDFSDWIELTNTGPTAVDLSGWKLTDQADPGDDAWAFPSRSLAAGDILLVFASGKDRAELAGELHTDFQLSAGGEYLALIEDDGTTIASAFDPEFPAQESDISYSMEQGGLYFTTPSPGTANGAGFVGFVGDTQFSVDRGFYAAPINLVISSSTEGALIIYTTDGSEPSASNGTSVAAPASVTVSETTPLRAIAVKDGYLSTNVDTHTYIFTADVITQGNTPEGYPLTWKGDGGFGTKPADYEMDPEVTESAEYSDLIDEALLAIPTIFLVTEKENLFDPTMGIYQNPQQSGSVWERPVSFEIIHPDGEREGIQVDAGIRIQGGHTRLPSKNPKHSFRLSFTSDYGPTKLDYDLFPDDPDAAREFDQLILRGSGNQSWLHHNHYQEFSKMEKIHVVFPEMRDMESSIYSVSFDSQIYAKLMKLALPQSILNRNSQSSRLNYDKLTWNLVRGGQSEPIAFEKGKSLDLRSGDIIEVLGLGEFPNFRSFSGNTPLARIFCPFSRALRKAARFPIQISHAGVTYDMMLCPDQFTFDARANEMPNDRVKGLDSGADDYLVKPFSLKKLLARVRALLRRNERAEIPAQLKLGSAEIDLRGRTLLVEGEVCELNSKEGGS